MNIHDKMYWEACKIAQKYVTCKSRQIGAIIVKDGLLRAYGYNGPPEGIKPCNEGWYYEQTGKIIEGCPRYDMDYKSGQGLEYCIAVHAERSALIHAARDGVNVFGATMYMNCGIPCKDCLVEIIEAGISEIVCTELDDWYDLQSEYLLKNSTLKVRLWDLSDEENV